MTKWRRMVEGDEEGEAGADGLGHVPHRPHRPQALLEELGPGESLHGQHIRHLGLGLDGGEVGDHLLGEGAEDIGIALQDLPGPCVVRAGAQECPRPQEIFQHSQEAGAVAAPLQGKKFAQPRRGLGRRELRSPGDGHQPVHQRSVVVPRKDPGGAAVPLRALPGLLEQAGGVAHPGLGGAGRLHPAAEEPGVPLRGEDIRLEPGAGGPAPLPDIERGRQELFDERVGPAPPAQLRRRPLFFSFGHGERLL